MQLWSSSDKHRPNPPKLGQIGANVDPTRAQFGRTRPTLGESGPKLYKYKPSLARIGFQLNRVRPPWADSGQTQPYIGPLFLPEFGQMHGRLGQIQTKVPPEQGQVWAHRTEFGRSRPVLVEARPSVWPNIWSPTRDRVRTICGAEAGQTLRSPSRAKFGRSSTTLLQVDGRVRTMCSSRIQVGPRRGASGGSLSKTTRSGRTQAKFGPNLAK